MKYYVIMFLILPLMVIGQSPSQNYLKTRIFINPYNGIGAIKLNDTISNINYFDGLGRLKQTINVKAGGNGEDIITPFVYDTYGRETRKYLSYADPSQVISSSSYVNNNLLITKLSSYYSQKFPEDINASNINPYGETFYEASPLNRVLKKSAPGKDWIGSQETETDHTVKFNYSANVTDEVIKFSVNYVSSSGFIVPELGFSNLYAPNQLMKKITRDENWTINDGINKTVEEFFNTDGQLVLKRTYDLGKKHDTYYVYSDIGNLTYVIPPLASDIIMIREGGRRVIDQLVVNGLCYIYRYDSRNRLVEKYIPDNGWTYMVYDKLDRIAMMQDEGLRAKKAPENNWLFNKYDKINRLVITGSCTSNLKRLVLQNLFDEGNNQLYEERSGTSTLVDGLNLYYTNNIPYSSASILTVNYYDDNNFDTKTDVIGGIPLGHPNKPYTKNVKGLPTGGHVRILGTNDWITNLIRYDEKGRTVLNWSYNSYFSSWDLVTFNLDFTGKILRTSTQHKFGSDPKIESFDFYTYDNMGRVLDHSQSINGNYMLIAWNKYDELGKLQQKKVGGKLDYFTTSPAYTTHKSYQTLDYTYNIRGWLKSINNPRALSEDLFGFGIKYNDNGEYSLYNGNISQTNWKMASDNILRKYDYNYDALNRIKDAVFADGNFNYNEGGITYDMNGNIKSLNRYGINDQGANKIIDNLSYTYKQYSNELLNVVDSSQQVAGFNEINNGTAIDDYRYDDAGNMQQDLNKGIGLITYNYLNLPTKIHYEANKYIEYIYDATGKKLEKKVFDAGKTTSTKYANGYVYQNDMLEYFPHTEGYVRKETNGDFTYVYQYKDHLGNVRLSYSDTNGDGVIADAHFNEGFEDGVSNWGGIGSNIQLELDSTIFRSGKYSAKITSPGPDGRFSRCDVSMNINNNKDTYYTYTVYIKSNRPNAEIVLFMKTAEETGYSSSFDSYAYHGYMTQWTKLEKTVLVPANIKKLWLRLDTNADGTVWFDDVSIKQTNLGETEIIEQINYYPFGMKHEGYNSILFSSNLGQKIKYNGKELQDELQLNVYDYGARNYDPAIGRWFNIDPKAEASRRWSAYTYCYNSPMIFVDSDGMLPTPPSTHIDEQGNVLAIFNDGNNGVYQHKRNADGGTPTEYMLSKRTEKYGTSRGGTLVGETWTPFGFADFGAYTKDRTIKPAIGAKIDLNSNWATNQVASILNDDPSLFVYAIKARSGKQWDIKRFSPNGLTSFGSKLFGKFASARDAGNFAAGAVAERSIMPNSFSDYGFGTYNASGNSVLGSLEMIATDLMMVTSQMPGTQAAGVSSMSVKAESGEDPLSKAGIEEGKRFMRSLKIW